MNRKHQHDGHIIEWRTSPIGKRLRMRRSETLHDQHVKLFNSKMRKSIANNTRWTRDESGKEQCIVWTGAIGRGRLSPYIGLKNMAEQNAITQYQRMYAGIHLPRGLVWSKATCGNECCIRHRFPQTQSEFQAKAMETRATDPAWVLACTIASRSRSTFTQQQVAQMHALRAEGMTHRQVAEAIGANVASVANVLMGRRWVGVKHAPSGISFITSQLLGAQA